MRTMPLVLGTMLLAPVFSFCDDLPTPKSKSESKTEKDYTEFSKLVHKVVVSQAPKEFEHLDGWGNTIPLPDGRLPLPKLRTYLKTADNKVVLPHGAWKKLKLKLDDPAKDIKIQVKEFKSIDPKTYRLVLDADIALRADGEWQQWQKGLMLVGVGVETDAWVNLAIGCDVGVALNFTKIPPEVDVFPKITDLALDLRDIRGRNGPIFSDEKLKNDIKGLLRGAVKSFEPQLKDLANQAIVQGLKGGKGTLSAGELLKALPK